MPHSGSVRVSKEEYGLNSPGLFPALVDGAVSCVEGKPVPALEIENQPHSNSLPVCSLCGQRGSGYYTLPERYFESSRSGSTRCFLSMLRGVESLARDVRAGRLPRSAEKHRRTNAYAWLLSGRVKRLNWKEVTEAFRTSRDPVVCSVKRAAGWGLAKFLESRYRLVSTCLKVQ